MQFHVVVYTLADKYDISTLKKLAASHFEEQASKSYFKSSFLEAVNDIYTETRDRGLRDIASRIVNRHVQSLFTTYDLRRRFGEIPGLAVDIASLQLGWTSDQENAHKAKQYRC